jgi:hypothetical protein
MKSLPNTACTRQVGSLSARMLVWAMVAEDCYLARSAAFSGSLRGLKLVPSKCGYLVPPTSG